MKPPTIADHLAALPKPPANQEWRRVRKGETIPKGKFTFSDFGKPVVVEDTIIEGVTNGQHGRNYFWYLVPRRENSKKKLAPKS